MIDYKETRRTASKKKKLSNIILAIRLSIWLCLGISGTLIGLCAVAYVVNSEVFHVKSVEIKGNVRVDRKEILTLVDLDKGDNIFGWDMEAARHRLLGNPWIRDIRISRSFIPAGVSIGITEHRPTATLAMKDKRYYISEEGAIFAPASDRPCGIMINADNYTPRAERAS